MSELKERGKTTHKRTLQTKTLIHEKKKPKKTKELLMLRKDLSIKCKRWAFIEPDLDKPIYYWTCLIKSGKSEYSLGTRRYEGLFLLFRCVYCYCSYVFHLFFHTKVCMDEMAWCLRFALKCVGEGRSEELQVKQDWQNADHYWNWVIGTLFSSLLCTVETCHNKTFFSSQTEANNKKMGRGWYSMHS